MEFETYYMWHEVQDDFVQVTKDMYDEKVEMSGLVNNKFTARRVDEGDGVYTMWWDVEFGNVSGNVLTKFLQKVKELEWKSS